MNKFPGAKIIKYGSNDVTLHAFDLFLSSKISRNVKKKHLFMEQDIKEPILQLN